MAASIGYRCVAIRPCAKQFNPQDDGFTQQAASVANAAESAGIRIVLDCDAKYLPDITRRRGPALVSPGDQEAQQALDWLECWIDVAKEHCFSLVYFSSGACEDCDDEQSLERLASRVEHLSRKARTADVPIALRPRAGDVISTVAQYERFQQWLNPSETLRLAADVGAMLSGHELPLADRLQRNREHLGLVLLSDHRAGVAGDQRIGQGDVALGRIVESLNRFGYSGPAIVRVDGHHDHGFELLREGFEIFSSGNP